MLIDNSIDLSRNLKLDLASKTMLTMFSLIWYQQLIILLLCTSLFESSNTSENICVIGDVHSKYYSKRDPRTLMGTYTLFNASNAIIDQYDTNIIDLSKPIYYHKF